MKPKVIISGSSYGHSRVIKSVSEPHDSFSIQKLINNTRTMLRNLMFLGFLINVSSAISLVEILFKNNINEARCQAQCLDAETTEERTRCVTICRVLEADPHDVKLQLRNHYLMQVRSSDSNLCQCSSVRSKLEQLSLS